MKNNLKYYLLLLSKGLALLLFLLYSCKTQTTTNEQSNNSSLNEYINTLIDEISNDNLISFIFVNKNNSTLPWYHEGENAAWCIEHMLNNNFNPNNIIVKNGKAFCLEKKDLVEIQRLYKEWWRNNCNKSESLIKLERSQGNSALKGSKYEWRCYSETDVVVQKN